MHFEFRFALKDGILTVAEKTSLFETMLTLFGAGAKTNVGYGQLVRANEYRPPQIVRTAFPAGAGGNQTNFNNNRNNNHNNRNPRATAARTSANSNQVRCPHCGKMTWIRYQNGNLRKTCSNPDCCQPLDFTSLL